MVSPSLIPRDHEFDPTSEADVHEFITELVSIYQRHGVKWFADGLVAYLDWDAAGCTCEPNERGEDCVRCYIRTQLNMDVLEDA